MNASRCQCDSPTTETRYEGNSQVLYCTKCGEPLLATTKLPDIDLDGTTYQIRLVPNEKPSVEQLKAIAKVTGANLLQAKELAAKSDSTSETSTIFEGRAATVQRHRKELNMAGVEFEIAPDFPYDESVETTTIFFD